MSETSTEAQGGIGLTGAVFLVFLVLKLTGHVDWSWWWVTAPLWGGLVAVLGIAAVVVLLSILWRVFCRVFS